MVRSALFANQQPGGVLTIQAMEENPGNVLFVSSTHTDAQNALGGGKNPDRPFATLAYVMTNAASLTPALAAGDTIYLMPGHAETIGSAAAIASATAGVRIIGLGQGSAIPLFTFSATASTWTVTAAGVEIKNIRVTSSVNELVKMFSSSAADLTLDHVDYIDPGSAKETLQFLLTTSSSDRVEVKNCRHNATTAGATAQAWIRLIGCDSPRIHDNLLTLTMSNNAASVSIGGDASVRSFMVYDNLIVQLGGTTQVSGILFADGATGLASKNGVAVGANALTLNVDVGNAGYAVENYALNTPDKSGIIIPGVDT